MNRTLSVLVTLAAIGFSLPASTAGHCQTWTTSQPELDTTSLGGAYYVDLDFPVDGIWIYEESNGIPGLQRGDELYDDTCHGMIESDTIIL